MKKNLSVIFILFAFLSWSQETVEFKPKVEIVLSEKVEEYKEPASILFVFQGDTHLINYFLDLRKNLRRTLRKLSKKKIRANFNFDMKTISALESDLKRIPSKKNHKGENEAVCYVALTDFKSWDNGLVEKRKQNYNLNFLMKQNPLQIVTLKLILNVTSFNTIASQNKNCSKLFCEKLMKQ